MRAVSSTLLLLLGALACARPAGVEVARELDAFRLDQVPEYPGGLPLAWAREFDRAMVAAPAVEPGAPGALDQVRAAFLDVTWIHPGSVVVESALPEGFRVRYTPRTPRLVLTRGERPVAVVSADGVVLPEGLSEAQMAGLLRTPLEGVAELPAAGKRPADPAVQEAMRLWAEADTIRDLMGLPIVAIARQSRYPATADKVAPAMSFILSDGTEICWGRSEGTQDHYSADSLGRPLTMERKLLRLKAVWEAHPDLRGLGRVVLDWPQVRLFDERDQALPVPASWR
jgi:hypothetical protein